MLAADVLAGWEQGGKLLVCGNGGSAAAASTTTSSARPQRTATGTGNRPAAIGRSFLCGCRRSSSRSTISLKT